VDYYQHFWYWNDTSYPSIRGSARLTNLRNDPQSSGAALQHEFRRVVSTSDDGPCDGWDAKYFSNNHYYLYGYATNVPGGYSDTVLCEESNLSGSEHEEAELKTYALSSLSAISGSDPTNTYARSDAYYTRFTFYRVPDRQGATFLMCTEFENNHGTFPPAYDIATTCKHTTQF
jgi:hypothetical protein